MSLLPKVIKNLFLFSLVIFVFLVYPNNAFAQIQNYKINTNPDVPQNFHTYTQSVILELGASFTCQIAGFDPLSPNGKCLGIDPATQKIGFVENGGGIIGITGNLISMTFNIPVSTSDYTKYLASNFGIAKNTYAQNIEFGAGDGFQSLTPLLEIWKTFRNMVYLLFVLVFLVIGLGIMFRVKIDPRTVMTIQNSIPKIVIGLILVTFSYAIAGFLIDLMYVSIFLIFNIFLPHSAESAFLPGTIQGSTPLGTIGGLGGIAGLASNAGGAIGSVITSLFDGTSGRIIAGIIGTMIGGAAGSFLGPIGGIVSAVIGGLGGAIFGSKLLGVIGSMIAFLIIAIALLIALIKLWFQLIKAYIFILIGVVLGPFYIAAGLIPGSSLGFGAWFRDILANLSAFPATFTMFLLGKVFIDKFGKIPNPDFTNPNTTNPFSPPFVGNLGDQDTFAALIGLGIVLLTPQVVTMVRSAIKAPENKFGAAIGQSIGAGAGIVSTPFSTVGRRVWGRDPYTREPYWLTKKVYEKFGKTANWASKAVRFATDTSRYHTMETERKKREASQNEGENAEESERT